MPYSEIGVVQLGDDEFRIDGEVLTSRGCPQDEVLSLEAEGVHFQVGVPS